MIAERIGCSPQEAKRKTKAREFLRWSRRFEQEWNEHSKLDHYLAQIAYHLYLIPWRMFGKKDSKPDREFKDFFIPFTVALGDEDYEKVVTVQVDKDQGDREDDLYEPVLEGVQEVIGSKVKMTEEEVKEMNLLKQAIFGAIGLNPDGSQPEVMKVKTRMPPKGVAVRTNPELENKSPESR